MQKGPLTICRRDTSASSAAISAAFVFADCDVCFPLVGVGVVVATGLVEAWEGTDAAGVADDGVASLRFDLAGGTMKKTTRKTLLTDTVRETKRTCDSNWPSQVCG